MVESERPEDVTGYSYTPANDYRIWLIGDSILDNSYWHDVGVNCTADVLRTLCWGKKVEIYDRATAGVNAKTLLNALNNRTIIQVEQQYVEHR